MKKIWIVAVILIVLVLTVVVFINKTSSSGKCAWSFQCTNGYSCVANVTGEDGGYFGMGTCEKEPVVGCRHAVKNGWVSEKAICSDPSPFLD